MLHNLLKIKLYIYIYIYIYRYFYLKILIYKTEYRHTEQHIQL
jgi:hypothetical protein